jgi:hypothetical protein
MAPEVLWEPLLGQVFELAATHEYLFLEDCIIPFGAAFARLAPLACPSIPLGIIATPAMTGIMTRHIIGIRMMRHLHRRRRVAIRMPHLLKMFVAIGCGAQIAANMSGLPQRVRRQRPRKTIKPISLPTLT